MIPIIEEGVEMKRNENSRVGLSHELQHSFDVDKKFATYETNGNGIKLMEVTLLIQRIRLEEKQSDPKELNMVERKYLKTIGVT